MQTYTLTGATLTIAVGDAPLPLTISLQSTAVGRAIEISVDGGVEFFPPTLDVTLTEEIVLICKAAISHVKVTGEASDVLTIISGS